MIADHVVFIDIDSILLPELEEQFLCVGQLQTPWPFYSYTIGVSRGNLYMDVTICCNQ